MPEEAVTEAGAVAGPFDQPRDVGDDEAVIVSIDHTEGRDERSEGIVRDPRSRRRNDRQEGGLSGVGETHQADVGDQLQRKTQLSLFARTPGGGEVRSLSGGRGEIGVAPTTAPASGDDDAISVVAQIAKALAFGVCRVEDLGADGQGHDAILTGVTGLVAIAPVLTVVRPDLRAMLLLS